MDDSVQNCHDELYTNVLTPDIFDKLDETEPGVDDKIHLTDTLQKLDSVYGVTFEGRTYDIGNRLEWLKT